MTDERTSDLDASTDAATGVEGLDDVLRGGLPRHRLYVVNGRPGSGKTTLALQFLLEGARHGEAGVYVTLSETKDELTAVARSHGWSLDPLTVCELTIAEETLRPDTQYTLFHPSEVELGATTRVVLEQVERVQPSRVVFDSLAEMRLLARDPLRFRRQILGLKQFFIGRQCTVLLLDDLAADQGEAAVDTLVNGVLTLEQLAPMYGAERRRLRVVKLRGARYRGGYHDFAIRTGGIVVFPRLVAAEHRQTRDASDVTSGVPALDALVGGGLARGTSTLVLGPAGSGKSSVATRYVLAASARGERSAVYVFDELVETYLARAAGLGMDLRDAIARGLVVIHEADPAEVSPGEFAHRVRASVERDGADVVVIDSLNGYLHAMPEERFLTVHLHELLKYLSHRGVLTLMICAQHGLVGGEIESPVDVSYLADTVVLMRYFEAAGDVRAAMSVLKKRTGVHERSLRELRLGADGLRLSAPLHDFEGILRGLARYTDHAPPRPAAR